jgi:hypothetical protein
LNSAGAAAPVRLLSRARAQQPRSTALCDFFRPGYDFGIAERRLFATTGKVMYNSR